MNEWVFTLRERGCLTSTTKSQFLLTQKLQLLSDGRFSSLTLRVSWEMIVEKFTCCYCCFGWWWRQQQHFLISIIEIQLRSLRDVIFPCRSLFLVYIWTSVCRSACKDERGAALVFNIFANKIYIFVLFYSFPLCPTQLDYPSTLLPHQALLIFFLSATRTYLGEKIVTSQMSFSWNALWSSVELSGKWAIRKQCAAEFLCFASKINCEK